MAGGASAAWAGAPLTSVRPTPRGGLAPPSAFDLVNAARLSGAVTFAVADAGTGEILESLAPSNAMPPASVTKAPTALYALETLGPDHRFATRLVATGPVRNGRLDGDLILVGAGDPTLDTDALGRLASDLKATGLHEVAGEFRIDDSALPGLPWIDPDQPVHVGYNPTIGGMNLNFNRVHFQWKRAAGSYDLTMEARASRYSPRVQIARVDLADRALPVFTYEARDGIDRWTVARAALGEGGSRWLPVRRPSDYAAEVFRTLARSHGIVLRAGPPASGVTGATVLAEWQSPPLAVILRDMLTHSTNLTAEVCGLTASATLGPMPADLPASAARMDGWLRSRYGLDSPGFVDHSGLGYRNSITAADMVRFLSATNRLEPMLGERVVSEGGSASRAKTGTLNFTSALAGYIPAGQRMLAYAIFTADTARRDAIPPDQRERPDGARAWAARSRDLQRDLLKTWTLTLAA